MNPYAYAYVNGNPETHSDPTGQLIFNPGYGAVGTGNQSDLALPTPTAPSCGGPTLQPGPVASSGGVLPNDPGWHQVGSLIAFGYQYGQQIVAASVEEAFARKLFDWYESSTGTQVSLDRLIAYLLALTTQAYRSEFASNNGLNPFGFEDSNNVGVGFYYVTDAHGNLVPASDKTMDPVNGYDSPNDQYYGEHHSERRAFTDFYTGVLPGLKSQLQPGYTLHFMIFSQFKPCQGAPSACTSNFTNWGNALKAHVGNGVSVDFNVWRMKGNAYNPITSLAGVQPYFAYIYDASTDSTSSNFF